MTVCSGSHWTVRSARQQGDTGPIVAYAGEKGNTICLEEKKRSLEKLGVVLLSVPSEKGEINLQLLMRKLGELGIDSVLIEGGGTLNEDALQSGIVNEVKAFIAPKIFGGRGGKTPVEGFGVEKVDDAIKLQLTRISQGWRRYSGRV